MQKSNKTEYQPDFTEIDPNKEPITTEDDCIFCKIIKRQLPSTIVLENEYVIVFLDINPINYGHTLVVPKRHCNNFLQMTQDEEG